MASAAEIPRYTPAEYLALERKAKFKSEYHKGYITAMAGASREHNLIGLNLASEIRSELKGRPCEVYAGDMRVFIDRTGLYTYPDVVAVCGQRQFQDDVVDTLLNPTMIAEVLSPTTETYDRGKKFAHYRQLPSLREYVLISQDQVLVERYIRQGDDWVLTEFRNLDDRLRLTSIDCEIPLREIYARVEFPEEKAAGA
ncbi:MAG TPA: Uma2 family endonuclease [Isosphaeraceae bacterium]|nr:Uma2 family endonuclease [Isosphaeraceae bacterium]